MYKNFKLNHQFSMVKVFGLLLIFTLSACSTPEEKANAYVEKGNEFLKEGNIEKAKVEFKNALQLKKTSIEAIYGLSLISEKEGNWQQQYALLSEVVLKQPKHLQAQVKIGSLLLAANEMEKADDVAKKLLELDKEHPEVLLFMSAYSLKKGDASSAINYANKVIAKDPKLTDVYIVLASERMLAKDTAKAISFLDQGLKINSNNIGMRMMKVKIFEDTMQEAKVESEYRELIKINPETTGFRKMLGSYLFKHGRKEEAEAELRKIAQLNPKDIKAKLDVVGFVSQTKGIAAGRKELEVLVNNEPTNYDLKFALFNLYDQVNDSPAAEKLLLDIIDKNKNEKNGLKAKGYLAVRMLKNNKKEEAIKLIDEVLEHDARNEEALTLKSGIQIDNKEFDSAVANLRSVLRDNPNSVRTLLLLAKVHNMTGDNALAEEHYLKAFKASQNKPEIGLEYVRYLLKEKQAERAEKITQEILDIYPTNVTTLKAMSEIKAIRGDFAGAQEIADKLKLSANTEVIGDQLTGAIQSSQKNHAEGIAAFKRVYEVTPNNPKAVGDLAASYMYAGKFKEAQNLLKEKLASNPQSIEFALMLGQIYLRSGEPDQAAMVFNSVITSHPKQSIGYRQLATHYLQQNKDNEAQQVLNQGFKNVPNDLGLKLVQASIYEKTKKYDEAIKTYDQIYQEKPDTVIVVNNLASLLSDFKTDKASFEKAYKMSLALKGSESPYFKDTYAWSSYRIGKYEEALTVLQEVTTAAPDVAIFHYHLGMVQKAKGDKAKAKETLERTMKMVKSGDGVPMQELQKVLATL